METVKDLIRELNNLSEENKNKPIKIICQNGLMVYPEIRVLRKDEYDYTSEIVEIVLTVL